LKTTEVSARSERVTVVTIRARAKRNRFKKKGVKPK
jgi:hypothetical protein